MVKMKIKGQKEATILIITLWILTLLSAIALSVVYRIRIEIKLTGYGLRQEKAFCIAKAGVVQALGVLARDNNGYDSLNESWSNYSAELYGVNLFRGIKVGEGAFTVSYVYDEDIFTGTKQIFYGMKDEERKINVNKAAQDVLESIPGITPQIASSIRAWRGDADASPDVILNDDAYYQGLAHPYKRKGKPFDCWEELALVRGITEDILYGKDLDGNNKIDINETGLTQYITVYGDGLVNVNTAGVTVLRALGFGEDLSYRIVRYRKGYDEILGTGDDGVFTDVSTIAGKLASVEVLLPEEEKIIGAKNSLLTAASRYYNAQVSADISGQAVYRVSAVLDKKSAEGEQVIKWQE